MMIGNVSDAYNDYKIYPYALGNDRAEKDSAVSSSEECQTCKNRKYQDGSDEMVSFKSAAHVSPQAAAGRVRAHEGEHVSNAYDKAAQKNGTVVYASVSIHTSVCPECGRTYVSGGTTNTAIRYPNEDNPYRKTERPQMQLSFRGQILTLQSEVRKGDLLL